jgi:hypothetical protein
MALNKLATFERKSVVITNGQPEKSPPLNHVHRSSRCLHQDSHQRSSQIWRQANQEKSLKIRMCRRVSMNSTLPQTCYFCLKPIVRPTMNVMKDGKQKSKSILGLSISIFTIPNAQHIRTGPIQRTGMLRQRLAQLSRDHHHSDLETATSIYEASPYWKQSTLYTTGKRFETGP